MYEDTLCLESDCLGQSCVDYGPVSWYDRNGVLAGAGYWDDRTRRLGCTLTILMTN